MKVYKFEWWPITYEKATKQLWDEGYRTPYPRNASGLNEGLKFEIREIETDRLIGVLSLDEKGTPVLTFTDGASIYHKNNVIQILKKSG